MVLEERGDRAAQLAGAVAVDDAQLAHVGDGRFVEELLERASSASSTVQPMTFSSESRPSRGLQVDVDAATCAPLRRSRPPIDPQVAQRRAQPLAADLDFGVLAVNRDDDAFEAEPADDHASPGPTGAGCARRSRRPGVASPFSRSAIVVERGARLGANGAQSRRCSGRPRESLSPSAAGRPPAR